MTNCTHKIILFSETDFTGDALVIMANGANHTIASLADIKYKSEKYGNSNFDNATGSALVDKGKWIIYYNEIGDGPNYCERDVSAQKPTPYHWTKKGNGLTSIKSN